MNICKECKPILKFEGAFYPVELCPRHTLVDRLAETLRQYHLWHINDYGGAGQMDAETAEMLKEYDTASTSQGKS